MAEEVEIPGWDDPSFDYLKMVRKKLDQKEAGP
jgi:hypothetical protein